MRRRMRIRQEWDIYSAKERGPRDQDKSPAARAAGVDVGIGVGEDASDTEVAAKKITQVRTSRSAALL